MTLHPLATSARKLNLPTAGIAAATAPTVRTDRSAPSLLDGRRHARPTARRAIRPRTPDAAPVRSDATALSAGPCDPSLVPHRAVGLVDRAVGAVHQVPVEAAREPAVVGDRERPCRRTPPGPPRAPRPTPRRGCRSARRAAAAWRRTARAAGSGSAPADRPTATRTSAPRRARARSGPAPGPPARAASRRGASSPRCRISSSVRPTSSGCSWVCTNQPGRTRAPSRALPVCSTGSTGTSPTGRCSTSGSVPPAASSRRKCDLPEPLEPSTATRSPYQTSRSNGFISPVSSSCSQTTARLPVRPPLQPHLHLLLARLRRRRPGLLELAQPGLAPPGSARPCRSLYAAFCLYISTSALSLACSSSQRLRSSSKRANRSRRASW